MNDLDKYQKNIPDSRLRATQTIWGFATGMFILCVPLVSIARSAIFLPATVAFGAGIGTIAVWQSDSRSRRRLLDEQTTQSLEERIANLEAIASHSELDMQHPFQQQLELKDDQAEYKTSSKKNL
jgi:hypothetical protein